MNTPNNNIISEIAPERIFRELYDKATNKRKKQSLEMVNNACKNLYHLKSRDFSIPTIAKLIASEGGPSEQSIRNKNGEEYRLLIKTWAEYSDGATKKMPSKKAPSLEEENYKEISDSISSSTAMALFHIFVGRYERLKGELNALKRMGETNLIIDRRKSENTETQNSALVSSTLNLTERELEELKNAISEDFIEERGWTITNGRIKGNGLTIYNRGYLDAINKILELYNNNIPE